MSHDLVCSWLGLPADRWPPDHYTLLGLPPGESDPARIEQQVHERMERVRRYQLTHPDAATDAMNRLAQALICLTDPAARRAYDASLAAAQGTPPPAPGILVGPPARAPAPPSQPVLPAPPPVAAELPAPSPEPQTQLNWQTSPPPPRARPEAETATLPAALIPTENGTPVLPAAPPTAPPPPADSVVEAARLSSSARRGLGTKRALYYRIAKTRQLLWAWERIGRYLSDPARPLARPAEGDDLGQQLRNVRELLRTFPPLLGEVGQPGCYVLALARQPLVLPTVQSLVPSQRERLALDWEAGHKLLAAHRQFLREELRTLRRKSMLGRALGTVRALLADNPGTLLFVLAVVALNLAYRPLLHRWPEQLVVLSGLAALRVYLWWDANARLTPVVTTAPPEPVRPKRRVRPQRQAP